MTNWQKYVFFIPKIFIIFAYYTMKSKLLFYIPLICVILASCKQHKIMEQPQAEAQNQNYELATFGGGCFWCTEAMFDQLEGVISVESGYAGGTLENPTYEEVCTDETGHAEVIRIVFDPRKIDYEFLLEVFFHTHDPTTLNRQGADVGKQYRSIVFYHNENQKEIAEKMIQTLDNEGVFDKKIVTRVEPIHNYYPAEDYHQDYFNQNPQNAYCNAVVSPKVAKFRKKYAEHLKKVNRQ